MRDLFRGTAWLASVRSRLLLLIFVAFLPTALLLVLSAYREQKLAVESATHRLRHTAALAASHIELPIEGSRYTLAALGGNASVRGGREPDCTERLNDVLRFGPRYTGFALLDPDGSTQCSTSSLNPTAVYGGREPFKRAVATQALSVGKPAIGVGSGKAIIPVYLPLIDAAGQTDRVMVTGIDLQWVAEEVDHAIPEISLAVLIFDRGGTSLFRYPANEGQANTSSAGSALLDTAGVLKAADTLEEVGRDGVRRLYAVASPIDYPQLGLAVAVGMPMDAIAGPAWAGLRFNLAVLALVGSLAFAGSWLIGDLTIRQRIAGLVEAAGRIGEGGRARVARAYGKDEFAVLARAFDGMADALERQVVQLRRGEAEMLRLNRTLRTLSECNQALVKVDSEPELLHEVCRVINEIGGYRVAWVGYAADDEAKSVVPMAWAGVEEGYLKDARISWADTERGRGPTGTAIRTAALAMARDLSKAAECAPWREAALARGYASSIALPLAIDDRTIGALSIYAGDIDAFGARETELLTELAGDLSYGVAALRLRAERKRAEQEILRLNADLERRVQQRTAELEASRSELEDLYNHAPCGYHSLDSEGRFLRMNDTELEWLGYRREEVVGRHIESFFTAESLRKHRQTFPLFKESGRMRDLEHDFVRKDGSVLTVSINATAVRDAEGRFLMTRSSVADIGGRKRVEAEINRLNLDLRHRAALLEAANKELESFSYSVSHDLRAPLRAMDGFAQILEEDYSDRLDAEARKTIAVIRQSSQHMGQLIDDLLALSRLGRADINAAEVDMAQLAHRALEEACEASERPPALKTEPLPTAWGDRALLQQVWRNLLFNAVKFSSRAHAPEVRIYARAGDSGPVYCISDNGAGFDMRYYDKLFGVFQRLHASDEYPGTGVGLAIVQRIVARHGGRVWAESKPGEGATFYFWLPPGGQA